MSLRRCVVSVVVVVRLFSWLVVAVFRWFPTNVVVVVVSLLCRCCVRCCCCCCCVVLLGSFIVVSVVVVGTSRHKSNDMSSTTSGVRDVATPTIGPYMPTIEGDAIQHASSTHLHGPQDQRPTSAGRENRDDCSLVLLDCFNQT